MARGVDAMAIVLLCECVDVINQKDFVGWGWETSETEDDPGRQEGSIGMRWMRDERLCKGVKKEGGTEDSEGLEPIIANH